MEKCILIGRPRQGIHSCMIRKSLDIVDGKNLGKLFHSPSTQTIYNSRLTGMVLHIPDNVTLHICCLGADLIVKILSVET